jgi:RNase adapter protein RapZ
VNLFIITGLSGAGKTNALRTFEDNNFYCIDNLPATLIIKAISELNFNKINSVAISVDSRSLNINQLPKILEDLDKSSIPYHLIFLSASCDEIIKRFNESRRKHPLIKNSQSLDQAIFEDAEILSLLSDNAIHIDTSDLNLNELSIKINNLIKNQVNFHLHLISFAYKKGIPLDVDFIFDIRELPNPFYEKHLKNLSGLDSALSDYLLNQSNTKQFLDELNHFIQNRIFNLKKTSRKYLSIGFGCTGGRHRSVFVVEQMSKLINKNFQIDISIFHRDLNV